MRRRKVIVFGLMLAGLSCLVAATLLRQHPSNADVLRVANSMPAGGGYCDLWDTGVADAIVYDGITILPKSKGGYYCSGFTFDVVMRVAAERGLLEDVSAYQIKRFQREWYGATPASRLKQVVTAMETLGIGHEVYPLDAQPGDFIVFSRPSSGHNAVFLGWIKHNNQIQGLRYRSSQPSTDGVGNEQEYFNTSGGDIIPKYFFVARLN
jgi:cell wall-associated NlpC family hydrolase